MEVGFEGAEVNTNLWITYLKHVMIIFIQIEAA